MHQQNSEMNQLILKLLDSAIETVWKPLTEGREPASRACKLCPVVGTEDKTCPRCPIMVVTKVHCTKHPEWMAWKDQRASHPSEESINAAKGWMYILVGIRRVMVGAAIEVTLPHVEEDARRL